MADDPSIPFAAKVHDLVASALDDVSWDKLAGPISEVAFEYATAAVASDRQKGLMLWDGNDGLRVQVVVIDRTGGDCLIEGPIVDLIDIFRLEIAHAKEAERAQWRKAIDVFYQSAVEALNR